MFTATFATLSSSTLFLFAGYLHLGFAFWVGAYAVIGTILGNTIIFRAVKKSGRPSYLVFLLSTLIGISFIVVVIVAIITLVTDLANGDNVLEFNDFCDDD
jgi:membrane protease YdiL (CAAX protease family)